MLKGTEGSLVGPISFFSVDKPERCRPWGKPVICLEGAHNDARNISVESANSAIQEILSE